MVAVAVSEHGEGTAESGNRVISQISNHASITSRIARLNVEQSQGRSSGSSDDVADDNRAGQTFAPFIVERRGIACDGDRKAHVIPLHGCNRGRHVLRDRRLNKDSQIGRIAHRGAIAIVEDDVVGAVIGH